MISRRPYLLRAMHEWICDSGQTPHLVVDASVPGVDVPRQFVDDGKIVLNVSWSATGQLQLGNEAVTFSARFSGASMAVHVPVSAVLAIYARETGHGMIFAEEEVVKTPEDQPPGEPDGPDDSGPPSPPARRNHLKVVK